MRIKMKKKKIINMTEGKPLPVITAFAVPMILSNLFQQLYNVIDSVIVGKWLGMDAFAAVGCTGMVTAVLVQVSTGLSLGGSIVVSQLFGAGKREEIRTCTTTLAIFMTGLAVVVTALLTAGCMPLLSLIRTPPEAAGYARSYLLVYATGCVPVFLYNALNGIYSGLGNSRAPLRFLLISSAVNIALDTLFIIRFHWGVGGAAAATVISQTAALLMALFDIPGLLRELGGRRVPVFDGGLLAVMLRLAVPAALQQSVVSIGNVVVQATINSFGTTVMAACAAATKIINLSYSVSINYSNAFANYVGQNMGAKKPERIYDGLRHASLFCGAISLAMTAVMMLFAEPMVGLFMGENGADALVQAQIIDIGSRFIRVNAGFLVLLSLYMLTKSVFKGSGDMGWFIFVTLLSFIVRLTLTVGFAHRIGVWIIWWSYGIGYIIAYAFSLGRFVQGGWKRRSKDVLG